MRLFEAIYCNINILEQHYYTHISTLLCTYTVLLYFYVLKQDPDAPTRQNKHLSELDAKDEQSLMKHLFVCIRAGQLSRVLPH